SQDDVTLGGEVADREVSIARGRTRQFGVPADSVDAVLDKRQIVVVDGAGGLADVETVVEADESLGRAVRHSEGYEDELPGVRSRRRGAVDLVIAARADLVEEDRTLTTCWKVGGQAGRCRHILTRGERIGPARLKPKAQCSYVAADRKKCVVAGAGAAA